MTTARSRDEEPAADCSEWEALIGERLERALDQEGEERLAAHLEECASCRDFEELERDEGTDNEIDEDDKDEDDDEDLDAPADERDDELPLVDRDRYDFIGLLGTGGSARTWKAKDKRLDRIVAVKMLYEEGWREQFLREAQLTAQLQHPAIVSVHESGLWSDDGQPFFVMQFVEGGSLFQRIMRCKTSAERLALVPAIITIADALTYAHAQGIIHRDLKPSNIMGGDYGDAVVVDWGLAKVVDAAGRVSPDAALLRRELPRAGTVLGAGTTGYMAPEQAAGKPVDARADVYALGATLYHVLTGIRPYADLSEDEGAARFTAGEPPTAVLDLAPYVPRPLASIVARAMAHDASKRFPTIAAFGEDLRNFQAGLRVASHPHTARELLAYYVRRYRTAVAALVAILVITGIVGIVAITRITAERDTANRTKEAEQRRLQELRTEHARQELLRGDFDRAAVYVAEALGVDRENPVVRLLATLASRPLATLLRSWAPHSVPTMAARFSPDGSVIVTGGSDGEVRAWDAASGTLLGSRRDHGSAVTHLDFARNGERFVSSSEDGRARVWKRTLGEAPIALEGYPGIARALFTHDDVAIITVGADGAIRSWDPANGKLTATTKGLGGSISVATFDEQRRTLLTGIPGAQVTAWDATDPAHLTPLRGHTKFTGYARALALSRDGSLAIAAVQEPENGARLWHTRDPKKPGHDLVGHAKYVWAVAFSRDMRHVATASEDGTVRVWSTSDGALLHVLDHGSAVRSVAFTNDGTDLVEGSDLLVTMAADGTARAWYAATGGLVAAFPRQVDGVEDGSLSDDGRRLLVMGARGQVRLFDLEKASPSKLLRTKPKKENETDRQIRAIRFDRTGALLATAGDDREVGMWHAQSGERAAGPLIQGDFVSAVAFSPTADLVAAASWDKTLTIAHPTNRGAPVATRQAHEDRIQHVAFSRDGERLITASDDRTAKVWSAAGSPIATLRGHDDRVFFAELDPSDRTGARALTASSDHTARIWNATTGAPLAKLEGHTEPLRSASWSPDGQSIATGADDRRLVLWDGSGRRRCEVDAGQGSVWSIAFSPDSKRVVSAGTTDIVRVWDATSCTERLTLRGHRPGTAVFAAVYSHNGHWIATGGQDGVLRVWAATTGQLLSAFHGHAVDIRALAFSPNDEKIATADWWGRANVWDIETRTAGERIASVKELVPMRIDPTTMTVVPTLPVASSSSSPLTAHTSNGSFFEACDRQPAAKCVASLGTPTVVINVAPLSGSAGALALCFAPRADGIPILDPGSGIGVPGDLVLVHLAAARPTKIVRVWDAPIRAYAGAIGLFPDRVEVFFNSRRRSGTWGDDGAIVSFAPDTLALQERRILYQEWNGGWNPFYDAKGRLLHYDFQHERVVAGKGQAAAESWSWQEHAAKFRADLLQRLGLNPDPNPRRPHEQVFYDYLRARF